MLPNSNSFANLAGELQNYSDVEDPNTDLPAEASNELRADAAAMTRTCIRAWVTFEVNGGVCTVSEHDAVWGNDPLYEPVVSYLGVGSYLVTWPASVNDARGIPRAPNFKIGWGNALSLGVITNIAFSAANVAVVLVADSGGAIDPTEPINVFVI